MGDYFVTMNAVHAMMLLLVQSALFAADPALQLSRVHTNMVPVVQSATVDLARIALRATNVADLLVNSITYTNTYWDDSQVPATSFRVGTTAPTFDTFTDSAIYIYRMSATQDDHVYGGIQLSHRYKAGTDLRAHVHYAPMTSPTGSATNVVWKFAWTAGEIGSAFPTSTNVFVTNSISGFSQFRHSLLNLATIPGAALNGSDVVAFKLARIGTSTSDTYDADVALLSFDLHFQIDKPGSDNELPD